LPVNVLLCVSKLQAGKTIRKLDKLIDNYIIALIMQLNQKEKM
jgi:hypothetical protein